MIGCPALKHVIWVLPYLLIPIKAGINNEVIQFDSANFSILMRDSKTGLKLGNFAKLSGRRFKMSAFKECFVKKESLCIMECLAEVRCKSINVVRVSSGKYECGLLESHIFDPAHYKMIEEVPNHDLFTLKTKCLSDPCKNNGTCYPDYTQDTYRCNCKSRRYSGDNCEKVCECLHNDSCTDELCEECLPSNNSTKDISILNFPTKSINNYAEKRLSLSIAEFTISIWVQFDKDLKQRNLNNNWDLTLFSFENSDNKDELAFHFNKEKTAVFSIHGSYYARTFNSTQAFDGHWHHIALSWSAAARAIQFYLDGSLRSPEPNGKTIENKHLTGQLRFALGQEQDNYHNGGYDVAQSFQGNLTGFNMWDRQFNEEKILKLSKQRCPFGTNEQPVLKWSDIVNGKTSGVIKYTVKSIPK